MNVLTVIYVLLLFIVSLTDFSIAKVFDTILIKFGRNLGNKVKKQIIFQFTRIERISRIEDIDSLNEIETIKVLRKAENPLLLLFGNTNETEVIIPSKELLLLEPESFRIVSTTSLFGGFPVIACNGLPLDSSRHQNISFDIMEVHYGAVLGSFALMEKLGFAFLHPLEPFIPYQVNFHINDCKTYASGRQLSDFCLVNETESPYWPERSFHIHTQHPLELTEVLQGHDIPQFGPHGPHCADLWSSKTAQRRRRVGVYQPYNQTHTHSKVSYCERWEDMVPDVELLFQWAVANRLNKIEWLLLGNYKWGDERASRKTRLRVLTALGHDYSLMIGADCPIGNIQQHAWSMVDTAEPVVKQLQQIRERVDWIFDANFDFISTESGSSEFTHPECGLMLQLINEFAEYANGTWGREAAIKVHCSTGQHCKSHFYPGTSKPLNFNFLPYYATSKLGVFPHTIQLYALDDPTAGSYGNENFSYVEDYLVLEAKRGQRSVMFYGETAYWVNVDIDVPLFLPLYGQRRLHDLRRLAGRELREDFRMDGQMNFDSGWEWGYWISDVVTARASWNPHLNPVMMQLRNAREKAQHDNRTSHRSLSDNSISVSHSTDSCDVSSAKLELALEAAAGYDEKNDQWIAFGESLTVVTSIFGSDIGPDVKNLLVRLAQHQAELLIRGRVHNESSPNIRLLSGIAYLSGNDPWIDLPKRIGLPQLQPSKVSFKDTDHPNWADALRLLHAMKVDFSILADGMTAILKRANLYPSRHRDCIKDGEKSDLTNQFNKEYCRKNLFINEAAKALLIEIDDCVRILSLRASHVYSLYLSKDPLVSPTETNKANLQNKARNIITEAAGIITRRELNYRVPMERIASWRENPTTYRFGYLWSAHSLYYWWRDQGIAEEGSLQSESSPCYLNRHDVLETAVGWGKYALELIRYFVNNYSPFHRGYPLELVNCFAPPAREYVFPRDLYPLED